MPAPLSASATTVGSLLSNTIFIVPAYQREYAWTDDQVEDFWNDLSGALGKNSYFLGLIVLTGDEKRKQVVDGQQRLITITLLAAAIRQTAIEVGRKALAERIESSLLKSLDYNTDEIVPRIELTDHKANQALHLLTAGGVLPDKLASKGSSAERMKAAYGKLKSHLNTTDRDEAFKQLGAWAEFIDEQLYIAVFEHRDEAEAYSVFEVVNTRGKQLTTADLLKNYTLRHTPEQDRDHRFDEWTRLSQMFEEFGNQQFVNLIRHTVNLQYGYFLPKDLYNRIAAKGDYAVKDTTDASASLNVQRLMEDLNQHAELYLQLIDPTRPGPADDEELGVFRALDDLGVTAVRPLMMALHYSDNPVAGMRRVLKIIVHRMIVGTLGTSSIERKFAESALQVYVTRNSLVGIQAIEDIDPALDDFESQLIRRGLNRGLLSFIRLSIIQQTITPVSEGTLQFIQPKQSAGSSGWPDLSEEQASQWGSTLANSLIVNVDRRPRGANSWDGFREHLLDHAIDGEIKDLIRNFTSWNLDALESISTHLAERALDVWY